MKKFVKDAITNTKELLPDYWQSTIAQRSMNNGAGSVYDATPEQIEVAVFNADWKETQHPDVMVGCRVFKANIGLDGYLGLISINPEKSYIVEDRKGTGNISLAIKGERGVLTADTYLIIGEEQGKMVVFTFHPGQPIRPSNVPIKDTYNHGDVISGKEAIALGFNLAKIIS